MTMLQRVIMHYIQLIGSWAFARNIHSIVPSQPHPSSSDLYPLWISKFNLFLFFMCVLASHWQECRILHSFTKNIYPGRECTDDHQRSACMLWIILIAICGQQYLSHYGQMHTKTFIRIHEFQITKHYFLRMYRNIQLNLQRNDFLRWG